jgi:hypothetical protein
MSMLEENLSVGLYMTSVEQGSTASKFCLSRLIMTRFVGVSDMHGHHTLTMVLQLYYSRSIWLTACAFPYNSSGHHIPCSNLCI